jgi:hypothetical protein
VIWVELFQSTRQQRKPWKFPEPAYLCMSGRRETILPGVRSTTRCPPDPATATRCPSTRQNRTAHKDIRSRRRLRYVEGYIEQNGDGKNTATDGALSAALYTTPQSTLSGFRTRPTTLAFLTTPTTPSASSRIATCLNGTGIRTGESNRIQACLNSQPMTTALWVCPTVPRTPASGRWLRCANTEEVS